MFVYIYIIQNLHKVCPVQFNLLTFIPVFSEYDLNQFFEVHSYKYITIIWTTLHKPYNVQQFN